jgi:hypothetical protein
VILVPATGGRDRRVACGMRSVIERHLTPRSGPPRWALPPMRPARLAGGPARATRRDARRPVALALRGS